MKTYSHLINLQAQAGFIAMAFKFDSPALAECAGFFLTAMACEDPDARAACLKAFEASIPNLLTEMSGKSEASVRDACARATKSEAAAIDAMSEARDREVAVAARQSAHDAHQSEFAKLELDERQQSLRENAARIRVMERKNEKWYETLCSVA